MRKSIRIVVMAFAMICLTTAAFSAGQQGSGEVTTAEVTFWTFIGIHQTFYESMAQKFNEAIGIDGIVLSKAYIDEKGGAAISVSYVTKKPIVFLGVGQGYGDLQLFDKEKLLSSIGI